MLQNIISVFIDPNVLSVSLLTQIFGMCIIDVWLGESSSSDTCSESANINYVDDHDDRDDDDGDDHDHDHEGDNDQIFSDIGPGLKCQLQHVQD